jgi:hypothetical protein
MVGKPWKKPFVALKKPEFKDLACYLAVYEALPNVHASPPDHSAQLLAKAVAHKLPMSELSEENLHFGTDCHNCTG